jgi:alpha-aminoadipate carrier protein LysW
MVFYQEKPHIAVIEPSILFAKMLMLGGSIMAMCPECENPLDLEIDEIEEGDIVACDECGSEYEIVGTEPLELARVDSDDLDEEDDELMEEEEEED